MKKYYVSVPVIAWTCTDVEAENKEDAGKKFEEWLQDNGPSLCHQCARTLQIGDEIDLDDIVIEEED